MMREDEAVSDKVTDLRVERRLRRLRKPDGNCAHCERLADRLSPLGPLVVTITIPNDFTPDARETVVFEFCSWECLALWANTQAGEILMPDLDHGFFGPKASRAE